jgi:hypothetical protein
MGYRTSKRLQLDAIKYDDLVTFNRLVSPLIACDLLRKCVKRNRKVRNVPQTRHTSTSMKPAIYHDKVQCSGIMHDETVCLSASAAHNWFKLVSAYNTTEYDNA